MCFVSSKSDFLYNIVDVTSALQQQQLFLSLNQSYSQLLRWHQELMERVHQLETQRLPHRPPPPPPNWARYSSESLSRDQVSIGCSLLSILYFDINCIRLE